MADDEKRDEAEQPEAEQPEAGQPEAEQAEPEQPEAEQAEAEQPEAALPEAEPPEAEPPEAGPPEAEQPEAGPPEAEQPEAPQPEPEPDQEQPKPRRRRKKEEERKEEVIPGAHLEPDLVLEEEGAGELSELAEVEMAPADEALVDAEQQEVVEAEQLEPGPVVREPIDLAADARYLATGKRKSAVARVILKPGSGTYTVNGRHLDEFFPRPRLQKITRQPLETAGYESRMDVVARIHGGGVSAQAGALRHGIARALVEADPALRIELKRRGFLTRDPRVKERKKAGLKKARKRPQFSKR
jgi:small subunit ribosomal protein S9